VLALLGALLSFLSCRLFRGPGQKCPVEDAADHVAASDGLAGPLGPKALHLSVDRCRQIGRGAEGDLRFADFGHLRRVAMRDVGGQRVGVVKHCTALSDKVWRFARIQLTAPWSLTLLAMPPEGGGGAVDLTIPRRRNGSCARSAGGQHVSRAL